MRKIMICIAIILALFVAGCQPGGEAIGGQRAAAPPKQLPGVEPQLEIPADGTPETIKHCTCNYQKAALCYCELTAPGRKAVPRKIINVPPGKTVKPSSNEKLQCTLINSYLARPYCEQARYINTAAILPVPTPKLCNLMQDCLPVRVTCPNLRIPLTSTDAAAVAGRAASLINCSEGKPKCNAFGLLKNVACQ